MTTTARLLVLAFSLFSANSAFAARAVMEATPSTLNSIFVSSTQARVGVSSTVPTHTLSVGGDINFSGSLYQNGVEFTGGGGGGDNLGSHIATMTIQAPYGIYASTISLTNTGNSITSLGGISVRANTSGLNNLGVFNFSQASNPYRLYLYDPTKTLSLVAGDGGKMSVISTSGTELLGVKNNGSELAMVGISSATPTHTLSVQGDINYSGTIYKNGISWPSGYDFIPSTATGYYGIYVASANYAANGGGGGVATSSAVIDGSPIGSIIAHSTTTPPSGYLYCDGSYVSTTAYAALFAVTGHRYSTYTVTGTPSVFQLPDLRGMFLRGALGNLNSRDPDANRVVGSTQTDTMQGHYHSSLHTDFLTRATNETAGGALDWAGGNYDPTTGSPITDGTNGTPRTGPETRPENIAVAYMIKYQHAGTATVHLATTTVFLASNNTWPGSNTFTGAVSVSSLTVVGGGITGVSNSSSTIFATQFQTTQTSFLNCVTGSTLTITTNGGRVMVGLANHCNSSAAYGVCEVSYKIDGVSISSNPITNFQNNNTSNVTGNISFTHITEPLSAGVHSFCLDFKTNADTPGTSTLGTLLNNRHGKPQFWVQELR